MLIVSEQSRSNDDLLVETGTLDRIAAVDESHASSKMFIGPMGAFVSGQVLRVDGGGQCWLANNAHEPGK